jgi:hypothetical protein
MSKNALKLAAVRFCATWEQTTATVIDLINQREVLVSLLPCELVDTDGADAVEVAVLETPANGVRDASEDGVPARPEAARGLLPR